MKLKTYCEVTREMIKACLDDEINELHESWMSTSAAYKVEASEIFKKFFPDVYEKYFKEYCVFNHIIRVQRTDGSILYLEEQES